jgi:hypothetical protein
MSDEPFLSRWSRRKNQSRDGSEPVPPPSVPAEPVAKAAPAAAAEPLPPIESLTPESDFTGFMKPDVDEGLKRRALKTLFQDPQFNVMDGLDTYIDDYSKPDPLPEGWLAQLRQVARLGDYQEPKPEPAEEAPGEATQVAASDPVAKVEGMEKPSAEQGFIEDSGEIESDTADGVIPPSPVRE